MQMHTEFLDDLHARLDTDPQILAAWLDGSFGRGSADRYSDIDLHLLVSDLAVFRSGAREWLEALRPLVLYKLLFDGQMVNALTDDGLRIDIWLHDTPAVLDPSKTKMLLDRAAMLRQERPAMPVQNSTQIAAALLAQVEEFWRCIALLPAVIGRRELLVSLMGLNIELNIVVDLLMAGYGRQRDRGVKVLNTYLGDERCAELEAALQLQGLNAESLVMAHMALASIVRNHGPIIAGRHAFVYPAALEEAVLRYVARELHEIHWEKTNVVLKGHAPAT